MLYNRLGKLLVSLMLTVAIAFNTLVLDAPAMNSDLDWSEVDRYLIEAVRSAHDSTEEFATYELDRWLDNLMQKVDDKFLNWYFSYLHQKKMEFSAPFTWLFLAGDYALNKFRSAREKKLNPNQAFQQKLIANFERKFNKLVLDPKAEGEFLKELAARVGRNYASALGMKFAQVKSTYQIPDGDWERYLNDLATLVYHTGNSESSLSPESLTNEVLIVSTAAIGGKVALTFASKAAAKIATKAGGAVAAKVGAQVLDPILGIGIVIWDLWDYNRMVADSRPVLRENINDYLQEVKMSILYAPENSIMAAIETVEQQIIAGVESQLASDIPSSPG